LTDPNWKVERTCEDDIKEVAVTLEDKCKLCRTFWGFTVCM